MAATEKQWWQSKTIAANLAAIVAIFLGSKGIPVSPEMIAAVLLNIGSIVGRAVAKKTIAPVGIKGKW